VIILNKKQWATDALEKIIPKVKAECERLNGAIPYIPVNNRYADQGEIKLWQWTNGFWGGILWQLYNATKEDIFRKTAEHLEERMDDAMVDFVGLHHDVGFQWLHTAVANYRITGCEQSFKRGLHAANILAGRYNPEARFINAWNDDRSGWMIIDCLMNLPLLHWAKGFKNLDHYGFIAKNHADATIDILYRGDGSVHHIAIMDKETGEALEFPPGQGYESGSSWSRGHAWALYGFALSFRHTGEAEYLDTAKSIAHYFIANAAATGFIPLCDFRAPDEPFKEDTTAALIAVCGLLEIAGHVGEHEKHLYESNALKILQATADKHADYDVERDGIIGGGTVAYNFGELHVPIIYGDYFFVEAVLRLLDKHIHIW